MCGEVCNLTPYFLYAELISNVIKTWQVFCAMKRPISCFSFFYAEFLTDGVEKNWVWTWQVSQEKRASFWPRFLCKQFIPHGMENKEEDGDSVARILVNFVPWLLLGVIFLDMAGLFWRKRLISYLFFCSELISNCL